MATLDKLKVAMEEAERTKNYNKFVELESEGDKLGLAELQNKDEKYQNAWRMKASLAAYWKVVQKRLADEIPLEIRYAL